MVMAYFGMLVSRFGLFHGWNEGKGAQKLHHHKTEAQRVPLRWHF